MQSEDMSVNRKATVMVCLVFVLADRSHAQTFSEWFKQKSTQKKYLLQQIAALKVYAGYLEEGYSIAKTGLNTIQSFKAGEFNLHSAFFSSLSKVNPSFQRYAELAETGGRLTAMVGNYRKMFVTVKKAGVFNEQEQKHIKLVFDNLLSVFIKDLDDLMSLLTADKIQLSDDERLSKIGLLKQSLQEKEVFGSSFLKDIKVLVIQRTSQVDDTRSMKRYLQINNQRR